MDNNQLQLVTFEQAKKLKEAGFDWPTIELYESTDQSLSSTVCPENHNDGNPSFLSAPTVSLALKWMRDVKGLLGAVSHTDDFGYWYGIKDMNNGGVITFNRCYETYEDAESALLDELLKLIEK